MPDKEDFIGIFKAETEERLAKLESGMVELEKAPDNIELVKELNREAHTIKGSARVFGYYEIQEIAHRIEDIFEAIQHKKISFSSRIADAIFKGLDAVKAVVEKIASGDSVSLDVSVICGELESVFDGSVQKSISDDSIPESKPDERKTEKQGKKKKNGGVSKEKDSKKSELVQVEEYIRVPLTRVNALLNLVGEMVINKMNSSQKVSQAKSLYRMSKELQKNMAELTEALKKVGGSRNSEVVRLMSGCNAGILNFRESVSSFYDTISAESFQLDPVIDELQARMKEMRMLPLSTIFTGFPRMVRDIASSESKEIELIVSGEDTELDKKVLEGIKDSLTHILRNCVDHGIETVQERQAAGKKKEGTIKVSAFHEAGNVVILIEDDGAGMDMEKIKKTAVEKQLLTHAELEDMSEREVQNIVFMNGYSTSPIITEVSGRGIGLDVVRRDIESLKGQVTLETEKDKGTRFILTLPLTIAIVEVLLIREHGMVFGLPVTSILESLKVNVNSISSIEGRLAAQVREQTIPLVDIGEVLNLPNNISEEDAPQKQEELSVVIASSLDKKVGFIVDEVISEEEVFIKSLGEYLGKVNNIGGATILGTGEVILILDLSDLINNSCMGHPAVISGINTSKRTQKRQKTILIAEDTLSIRELEKSILEAEGYVVHTAVDGLDALDKLAKVRFDLIVTDIRMPRMDGFELCNTVKQNEQYKDIPIVIVTTLEKEEDKRRGIEVGASAYIVKGGFEQASLIDTVKRLAG